MTSAPSPRANELAPFATRDVVRIVAACVIALTLWLTVADVWQLAMPGVQGDVRAGILLAAITIPLHVRHLIYGVRGERPPAGAWTLGILAIVTLSGPFFAGDAWMREFSPLAVSILLIVPGRWALVLVAAVVVAPLLFVGADWSAAPGTELPGIYLSFVIVWRTVTQIVPIRMLAVLRALDSANRELGARAVVQTRIKIDTELRRGVGSVLQQIVMRGETAHSLAETDPSRATTELQLLVRESRRGLADARRMVSGYRAASVRAEIDAAVSLLEASGAHVDVVSDDGVNLDAPNERARVMARAALTDALRGEPCARYEISIVRARDGDLAVVIRGDEVRERVS